MYFLKPETYADCTPFVEITHTREYMWPLPRSMNNE